MATSIRLADRAEVQPARGTVFHEGVLRGAQLPEHEGDPELSFRIFAAFRAHPHINNVLTHISRAKWAGVEQSLGRIFDLSTTGDGLSPLEENIVELMVGERGITGRILRPFFLTTLRRIVAPSYAERLIRHIDSLYRGLEWQAERLPPAPAPKPIVEKEPPHAGGRPNERMINVVDEDPKMEKPEC